LSLLGIVVGSELEGQIGHLPPPRGLLKPQNLEKGNTPNINSENYIFKLLSLLNTLERSAKIVLNVFSLRL
jgi:hypothetical protein